jgi:putative addiction module killer protein
MKASSFIEINIYTTSGGKSPFILWLEGLRDKNARYRIKERLDRVSLGHLSDHKSIESGLTELRLNFGPGYRIYFGKIKEQSILLLYGGDKSSQELDIKIAKAYWLDYLSEQTHEQRH